MQGSKALHQPSRRHDELCIEHLLSRIILGHPSLVGRPPHGLGLGRQIPLFRVLIPGRAALTFACVHHARPIGSDAGEILPIILWAGGVHTELRLPRRRRGQGTSTSPDVLAAVRYLVLIANDDLIAGLLNRNKLVTGHGNRWTRERVTALRSHHRIPVYRPAPDGIEPWLTLTQAAAHL